MKCRCSLNNKCEIIGLCDIQKFNQKISEFQDKSWVQVSISDTLTLSGDKPSIKNITKTFVDVKIIHTKLMNTPKSTTMNIEGLTLTGKLLLVAGEIIQRVLYLSNNNKTDMINSFKIKSPFTTYIVIDETVDISQDKYCIYPCVEYASIRPVNETTLNQNITLFLFAHKINNTSPPPPPPPPPPPQFYPNQIILKTSANEEILKIIFNTSTSQLQVTSTGSKTPDTFTGRDYFKFKLYTVNPRVEVEGVIQGDSNGSAIVTALNDKFFSFGDVIDIFIEEVTQLTITNYNGVQEYHPSSETERFRIATSSIGLIKIDILPTYTNEIIFKNQSSQELARIIFDTITNTLKVTPTTNTNDDTKLKLELYGLDGTTLNVSGEISANANANQFTTNLEGKNFKYGYIVNIIYENKPTKVEITNYPSSGSTNYNPKFDTNEAFIITQNGLAPYILKDKIQLSFYNILTSQTDIVAEVYFSKFNNNELKVISTGNKLPIGTSFFSMILNRINSTPLYGKVENNKDGSELKKQMDAQSYSFKDTLDFSIQMSSEYIVRCIIIDVNNNTFYTVYNLQRYLITSSGIVDAGRRPIFPSIIFKNDTGEQLAKVRFELSRMELFSISTDKVIPGSSSTYVLQFALYSSDGIRLKEVGSIFEGRNAQIFAINLNKKSFAIGDIIKISYGNHKTRVEIQDYPRSGDSYTPKLTNTESFRIVSNGLEPFVLNNSILLTSSTNQPIVEITFEKTSKKLSIVSTGVRAPSSINANDYFTITLNKSGSQSFVGTIQKGQDGSSLKTSLDGEIYDTGDTIKVFCEESTKVTITDLSDSTNNRTLNSNTETFNITNTGIEDPNIPPPTTYPNEIILKNNTNEGLANIKFDDTHLNLLISSLGGTNDDENIKVEIYESNGTTLKNSGEISPNTDATQFIADLNSIPFNYNNIINIVYKNRPNKVEITNFPKNGQKYSPKFDNNEVFLITPTMLTSYIIPNKIEVTYYSGGTNRVIAEIYLSKFKNEFKVISTGDKSSNPPEPGKQRFKMTLIRSGSDILTAEILDQQDASSFKQRVDSQTYTIGDILKLEAQYYNTISIFDTDTEQVFLQGPNTFEITAIGLKKIVTPPSPTYSYEIILKNSNNEGLANIKFDNKSRILKVTSLGNTNDDTSIKLEVYDKNGTHLALSGEILPNADATQFVAKLNNNLIEVGDVINIVYNSNPNKVEIINYPNSGQKYNPKLDINEVFLLTLNGLIPYILENKVKVTYFDSSSQTTNVIAEIYFSKFQNQLKVISTGNKSTATPESGNPRFKMTLTRNSTTILTSEILDQQDATSFKQQVDGQTYAIGDILNLKGRFNGVVIVANINTSSEIVGSYSYDIIATGLKRKS